MKKRTFAVLLCAVLLCTACARAEFSETFSVLQAAYQAGTPVTLNAELTVDEMNLSDEAKALLSSLLAPLSLTLSIAPDKEAVALLDGGEAVLSLQGRGLAGSSAFTPFLQLKSLFKDTLPLFYERLAQDTEGKESSKSLSIKNVGSVSRQIVYTCDRESAAALLPDLHTLLDAPLETLLTDAPYKDEFLTYWQNLGFAGTLTVKRYLDKDGADLGLQITVKAASADEDQRSVTLYGGYKEGKGAYLSFACPAVKGSNNFQYTLSSKFEETAQKNTWTLTSAVKRKADKKSYSVSAKVSLKNQIKDSEKITGTAETIETKDGVKTTATWTSDLQGDGAALSGTITLKKLNERATVYQMTAAVRLTQGSGESFNSDAETVDLTDLSEEERENALKPAVQKLTNAFIQKLSTLDEKSRSLLTHIFRTDAWMNGAAVPVSETDESSDGWAVDEVPTT